jgi:hypothetical protein
MIITDFLPFANIFFFIPEQNCDILVKNTDFYVKEGAKWHSTVPFCG